MSSTSVTYSTAPTKEKWRRSISMWPSFVNSHQPVWHAYRRDDKGTHRIWHKKRWITRLTGWENLSLPWRVPWTCAGGAANYLRSSSRSFKIANRTRAKKYISQSVTMRGNLVFHHQRNMRNMAHKIDVRRQDSASTVEENMQETKVNVQPTAKSAWNARKWNTDERVCKQISKPLGEHNVNKLNGRDNKEDYGEEEYYEVETKRITAKKIRTEYTFRLAHELRAVKDKGTQWFVTLKMKANHHSRDVKCSDWYANNV